ncbi:MAG: hypothetical protein AAB316_14155, partial [Bacteroidota bacterium]
DADGTTDGDPLDPCDPQANNLACPTGDFDGDGVANSLDPDPSNPCVPNPGSPACQENVKLTAKVFLGAAYDDGSGLMRDDLRQKGLIPLAQPYNSLAGFSYAGSETTTAGVLAATGQNAIVDWVLVELRSSANPATVVARKAGLLQRDGDVVSTDGISPLEFVGHVAGNFYVAVHHRNHLGAMSAAALPMSAAGTPVDFTSTVLANFQKPGLQGTAHAQNVVGSVRTLWAGNLSGGGTSADKIIYQGADNEVDAAFFAVLTDAGNGSFAANYIVNNVYDRADADMDGKVIYQGAGADIDVVFFTTALFPDNSLVLPNFIIYQQIP